MIFQGIFRVQDLMLNGLTPIDDVPLLWLNKTSSYGILSMNLSSLFSGEWKFFFPSKFLT